MAATGGLVGKGIALTMAGESSGGLTLLRLGPGVELVPVNRLPAEVLERLDPSWGSFALIRSGTRTAPLLLDDEMAALVEEFREPSSIPEVAISLGEKQQRDPRHLLKEVFPFLQRLLAQRFLVDADRAEDDRGSQSRLGPGDWLEDLEIVRSMQHLEDMEVYQVRLANGGFAALKIRGRDSQPAAERLHHEAEILCTLDGQAVPELLRQGEFEGRDYLLLEWARGSDALIAAEEWRVRGTRDARGKLLKIAVRVLETYAGLHARGILHGDVNPQNVLIDRRQEVTLIDFEDAVRIASEAEMEPPRERGGVSIFFEPEYARATLAGGPVPSVTEAGEQYALAALVYELIAGVPHLDFDLRWQVLLKQISEEPPRAFVDRGLPSWPEVEAVLSRALAKEPAARFPSVSAMAGALAKVGPLEERTPALADRLDELVERVTEKAAVEGPWMRGSHGSPGRLSVYGGAAGVALALCRMSRHLGRALLLELANHWIESATEALKDEAAEPTAVPGESSIEDGGEASPLVGMAGVQLVDAMIAEVLQQPDRQGRALAAALQSAGQEVDGLDLYDGLSSRLLTLCHVMRQCDSVDSVDRQAVLVLGEQALNRLWTDLERRPKIAGTLGDLGMAHGWAGFLHASLRWCQASNTRPFREMERRLRELADQAVPNGRGSMWPWRLPLGDTREPRFTAGWCNGSAGYAFLWCTAARTLGEDSYLELAEGAAWNAWESAQREGSLCCGLVGRAYAQLELFRATGEQIWLVRARELASLALREGEFEPNFPEGLFQGELGLAMLAADLRDPDQACFPILTAEPGSQGERS